LPSPASLNDRGALALMTGLLLLAMIAIGGNAHGMELSADQERYDVAAALSYIEDPQGEFDLAQVRQLQRDGAFEGGQTTAPNLGFTDSAYWFHLRLNTGDITEDAWLLEFQYPLLDYIDFYLVQPDGQVRHQQSGDSVPFHQRSRPFHTINFALDLEPATSVDLFLRVETSGAIQMPLVLWSEQAFNQHDHEIRFVYGLYYGLILALAIYNLLIFFSIRDVNYLLYVAYIATYGLFQFALNGLAFEMLWPESPWWNNRSIAFTMGLGMIFILAFSRSFLSLRINAPLADQLFRGLMVLFLGVAVASLILPYDPVIRAGTALTAISAVAIFVVGMRCWLQDFKPARYFMISWAALLGGMVVYTLKTFGLMPANFFTEFSIQIGSALEMIFLSLALADRIRIVTQENQKMQRAITEELESRVRDRTLELEDANRKLKKMNAIDGLTRLKNRQFFDESLVLEWRKASRDRSELSLLLLDVDHFKDFNDTHGHMCGDACLQHIATLFESCVGRAGDFVARYGGEEFVVLLAHTGQQGAAQVAENIRQKVADSPLEWEGQQLPLTVSAGVATEVPGNFRDAKVLILHADEALYAAKGAGRNQVMIHHPETGDISPASAVLGHRPDA